MHLYTISPSANAVPAAAQPLRRQPKACPRGWECKSSVSSAEGARLQGGHLRDQAVLGGHEVLDGQLTQACHPQHVGEGERGGVLSLQVSMCQTSIEAAVQRVHIGSLSLWHLQVRISAASRANIYSRRSPSLSSCLKVRDNILAGCESGCPWCRHARQLSGSKGVTSGP